MKHIFPPALFCLSLMASAQLMAADADKSNNMPFVRDARRLKQGTFSYHDLDHGKEVGTSSISIRRLRDTGNYLFSNEAAFAADFSGFRSQRWQANARMNFEPISASLEFVGDAKSSPVFELHYAAGRVRGFVVERNTSAPPARRPVDDPILENTVDQRIDWAAAISGPLKAGWQAEFSVYDPSTGVSRVVERVATLESIKTPAGVFPAMRITYEVEKRGKLERYVVFATQKVPRMMIREDFPNGVITELVKISE
jgi:hypothetical protein